MDQPCPPCLETREVQAQVYLTLAIQLLAFLVLITFSFFLSHKTLARLLLLLAFLQNVKGLAQADQSLFDGFIVGDRMVEVAGDVVDVLRLETISLCVVPVDDYRSQ